MSDRANEASQMPKVHPAVYPAVYLVGAGPGDPDLLTVKAQKLLTQADLVLVADSLVPPQVLQGVRSAAQVIGTAEQSLEDMLPLMIERVRSGQVVVRLQSGDPSLYSTTFEQMQALAQAGIPFEVVPGISAFQLAAARLRVELTVPNLVQTIILTRISGRTQVPATEELADLAAHQASLCLYLSARHVQRAQSKLMQHYPAETPVAICFRLGWEDEQIWQVPLSQMAEVTDREQLSRTTLYIISPALAAASWSVAGSGALSANPAPDPAADVSYRSRLYSADHERLFRPVSSDRSVDSASFDGDSMP